MSKNCAEEFGVDSSVWCRCILVVSFLGWLHREQHDIIQYLREEKLRRPEQLPAVVVEVLRHLIRV